jgi:CelD/BcsL family acetyltransferase involved in cellulose biosynthesis
VTAITSLDVTVHHDEACFGLPAWRTLLERDPNRHVFATPEWMKVWWDEFSVGKDLVMLTMARDGEVAAVVPLYRKREAGRDILRFVGGIDLTDYLGPVCSLENRDDVARALTGWLADTELRWDELDAHNMPVPLGFAEVLVDHADRRGFAFALDQEETSAVLPLPQGWDAYVASLPSKERHELRRKMRRLAREHPDAVVRSATEETIERDLDTFVDMHRGAEGHKGHFMRPEVATFFRRLARALLPLGWLRLDVLEVGGDALAATFGFKLDGRFYLYNSAYEPEARRLSPGFVLVAELVKRAIAEGLEFFDFLRGPERYKYQLGAEQVPLNNVRVLHPRGRGDAPRW